jgi:hypothetical protein
VSREFLWRRPWCVGCLAIGVKRKATLVDHIVPHRGDQSLFWNSTNWQPLCHWHHNSIKPELERMFADHHLRASDLYLLHSVPAAELTRARHQPVIGPDGFAIPGS